MDDPKNFKFEDGRTEYALFLETEDWQLNQKIEDLYF